MLERILDTSAIDMTDSHIVYELNIDLERMDKLEHNESPRKANAYKVKVEPSRVTYYEGLHRFRFEIQYGYLRKNGKFKSLGKPIQTQSESLPFR